LEDVAQERLERLANAATDGLGLDWEIHIGQIPMERYLAIVPQIEALMNDQPFGDHDMPPYKINLAGIRAAYAQMAERGGAHLMVLLMDGQTIAAMTEASWNSRAPDRAWQAFTGVAQPWRRKGLAKAVKARTLQLLQEHYPDVKMVETRNASVNAPMLAVNSNLGFRTVQQDRMYQVPLAFLETWLRDRAALR
jgi:RimJ/RimL family protein N-acetyltransferase